MDGRAGVLPGKEFLLSALRAASLRNDGLCRSVPVQQLRLGPTGRSVHGICYSVPDFMASNIALFLEHVSFLSSEFACGGSMAGLHYNEIRTHRSLNKDAPVSRLIQRTGNIKSHPILGGLHHHYMRI
jgi:hypothetical protein